MRAYGKILVFLCRGSSVGESTRLISAGELTVAGVAHFNHQLREDADRDEEFCQSTADTLGWQYLVERGDVRARASQERHSIEHAARSARHEFFGRACAHFSADVVAL